MIFILFLIWSIFMLKGRLNNLDNNFYNKIKITNLKTTIFKIITNLASAKFVALLCLILLIFVKNKAIPITIIINMIIMWGLIGILKNIFKRERPNINRLVDEKGYSYPSGHTMTATIFFGFIIFLIMISNLVLPLKWILTILLALLIILVGYTRVYLGVHYLSDIIGAILFLILVEYDIIMLQKGDVVWPKEKKKLCHFLNF